MATEGAVDTSVDQNAGGTGDNGAGNKDAGAVGQSGQSGQQTQSQPDAAGKTRDYDKEITGFRNDLKRERQARQQYERDLAAAKAELEVERKRVQAALGVMPQSPQDAQDDEIRNRFKQLFPDLADLSKEDIAAIRELKKQQEALAQTADHYWGQQAARMIDSVQSAVEKEIGGKLSDRQKTKLAQAYALAAENDPEFLDRHNRGDQTLVEQFAKEWAEDWFEPARRRVTQQETQRFRAVPAGNGRSIVTTPQQKIDVTDSKAVEDFLVKGFRERNGEFQRR